MPDNIAGAQIIKLEIPTVKGKSIKKIEKAIEEHNPDVILSIGQAGGRFDISVERVGINLDDSEYLTTKETKLLMSQFFQMEKMHIFHLFL